MYFVLVLHQDFMTSNCHEDRNSPMELFIAQFSQPFTGKCSYCYLCSLASKYIGSIKEILCIGNPSEVFSYFFHLDLALVNMSSKRP